MQHTAHWLSTVNRVVPDPLSTPSPALDPAIRKKVLRMIPYGLHVITARHENHVAAATIDWVTQSSFEPPMVVCCLRRDSQIYEVVSRARIYALHPLGEDQKAFAMHFFKNREASETQINGQNYSTGPFSVPILTDAPAHMVMQYVEELHQGDHAVVLGKVIHIGLNRETPSLLLRDTGWQYGG
jgi:flavin reductase (DIM6/NTAB) family NADH-FMN oxidoreductase RutF